MMSLVLLLTVLYVCRSVIAVDNGHQFRAIDDDDYSNDYMNNRYRSRPVPQLQLPAPPIKRKSPKIPLQMRQLSKDPWISQQRIEEIDERHVNQDVTYDYPNREMFNAKDESGIKPSDQSHDTVDNDFKICVRCPEDRTHIATAGTDRVLLEAPDLRTCTGDLAPKKVQFNIMSGPKSGSLLHEGSYRITGTITLEYEQLNFCTWHVHVVSGGCVTPGYLNGHCPVKNICFFTCRDSDSDLHGQSSLQCGSNQKWIGELPDCKARTWCHHPAVPERSHVKCKGETVAEDGLAEGSQCWVLCPLGWRPSTLAAAVCVRGAWNHTLACQIDMSAPTLKRRRHDTQAVA